MTSMRKVQPAARPAMSNPLDGANAINRSDLIPMDQPMSREQLEQRAR